MEKTFREIIVQKIKESLENGVLGNELEDREYTMKGTVKEHTTYNAQKQTVVTRCMEVK